MEIEYPGKYLTGEIAGNIANMTKLAIKLSDTPEELDNMVRFGLTIYVGTVMKIKEEREPTIEELKEASDVAKATVKLLMLKAEGMSDEEIQDHAVDKIVEEMDKRTQWNS